MSFKYFDEAPKRLLLIDVVGALMTGGSTAFVLATEYLRTGVAADALGVFAVIAAGLAIFGLTGLLFSDHPRWHLRWLAVLNSSYCGAIIVLCLTSVKSLTLLGAVYFVLEIIIVLFLSWCEWKVSHGVRIWPTAWWTRALVAGLLVLLLPYLFSRIASVSRRVTIHRLDVDVIQTANTDGLTLRIGCYNIAHGRGLALSNHDGGNAIQRIQHLESIADLLREVDADIVVLNEVDFDASWSNRINQARYLAEKTGYPYWVEQRNLDFRILHWTWRFGNVVLSKYPIRGASLIQLPAYSKVESLIAGQKQGLLCKIDWKGTAIQVMANHLEHRSENVRVASAKVLLDNLKHPVATFLVGDLNSTPTSFPDSATDARGENAIDLFSKRFQRRPNQIPTEAEFTFRADRPERVIDWIMVPEDWDFREYKVHASKLSDHRLIFADVSKVPEN